MVIWIADNLSTIFLPGKLLEPGIWIIDDLNTGLLKIRNPDVSVIQMFAIQIPTVFRSWLKFSFKFLSRTSPNEGSHPDQEVEVYVLLPSFSQEIGRQDILSNYQSTPAKEDDVYQSPPSRPFSQTENGVNRESTSSDDESATFEGQLLDAHSVDEAERSEVDGQPSSESSLYNIS